MYSFLGSQFLGMFDHVIDFTENKSCLTHEAFEFTFSKVGFECEIDIIFIFLSGSVKSFQHFNTESNRKSRAALKKSALAFKNFIYIFCIHKVTPICRFNIVCVNKIYYTACEKNMQCFKGVIE